MQRDINPSSIRNAEKDISDSIDIKNQGDIQETNTRTIADLRTSLDNIESKINDGALDGADKPNLTTRRLAVLDIVKSVIEELGQSIKGSSTPAPAAEPKPSAPGATPPAGLDTTQGGYGAWSQEPDLSSVQNKESLTEDYMNKSTANPIHKFG